MNVICKSADTFMKHGVDTAVIFDVDKNKKIMKVYVGKGCEDDKIKKNGVKCDYARHKMLRKLRQMVLWLLLPIL